MALDALSESISLSKSYTSTAEKLKCLSFLLYLDDFKIFW